MRKKMLPKILAFLALFGIVISVVGTGILFIVSSNNNTPEKNIGSNSMTKEDLEEFVKKYDTSSGSIEINSGILDIENDIEEKDSGLSETKEEEEK